jgi:hypothetical protein
MDDAAARDSSPPHLASPAGSAAVIPFGPRRVTQPVLPDGTRLIPRPTSDAVAT